MRNWWSGESANRLDWALEVAGGLELQLVSHRMDLETIEPGPGRGQRSSRLSPILTLQWPAFPPPHPTSSMGLLNA
jgi:hypothetical protein